MVISLLNYLISTAITPKKIAALIVLIIVIIIIAVIFSRRQAR
jgi:hypothetical protein